jgi:hypothetical protein
LWRKEFKWKEFRLGYLLQTLLNKKPFINFSIYRASKNKKKAEKIVGVIGHQLPKTKLLLNI